MRTIKRYVSRAVLVKDDKILLAKSDRKSNFFLPGGGIEACESAATALLREIREELNMDAEIVDCIGIIENNWVEGDASFYETNFLFSVDISGCYIANCISAEDGLSFEWVPLIDIGNVDIRPDCIKKYLNDIQNGEYQALWCSNF